jgi:tetratricopeptide (TPR) repeat protein
MHPLFFFAAGAISLAAVAAAVVARRTAKRAGLPNPLAILIRHPKASLRAGGDETVVHLAGQDDGLALNEVALRCWELIDGTRNVLQVARDLSSERKVPLRTALREVRGFSRRLKLAFLALEPREWDLIHIHEHDLFTGAAGEGVEEIRLAESLVAHAATCLRSNDGSIEPWRGTTGERRRAAAAMRAHRLREADKEEAAREFKRGWDLCASEKLVEAEASFRGCVKKAPAWANAHYQLGYVNLRRERYKEARSNLEKAESLSPGFYMVREYLDQARRLAAGDLSHEAFTLFDKANAAGLQDPDATIRLASRALEISPNYPSARLILARAYQKKELLGRALTELRQAIQMNPDRATLCHALLSRGSIFMAQGRADLAMREWEMVIEIDGSATATRSALATLAATGWVH